MAGLATSPKMKWEKQRHKKDYRQSTGYRRKTKEIQYILIDISEKENRTDGAEIISDIKQFPSIKARISTSEDNSVIQKDWHNKTHTQPYP